MTLQVAFVLPHRHSQPNDEKHAGDVMTVSKALPFARGRRFLAYYKPYLGLLTIDLVCAFIVSATTLIIPLCARYVTPDPTRRKCPGCPAQNWADGRRHAAATGYRYCLQSLHQLSWAYDGRHDGKRYAPRSCSPITRSCRSAFMTNNKTGQLMSRLTNDLFWLSEFYHHGPEDMAIAILKFLGAFIILLSINIPLTLLIFAFLPFMAVYAFYFNKRMNRALQRSKERIGDVNTQVEDTLSGIRVVKSFTNEAIEQGKFDHQNARFVGSRDDGYRSEAFFSAGMDASTQLFTIAVIVFGSVAIVNQALDLPDLLTFLLYVGALTEPVKRAVNFARLYQEGITGFNRFVEMMEIEPDILDAPGAIDLGDVDGHIEFRDVSFKYKENHREVIKNISLDIQPGEYVALVGQSGVGKTTLCSLIPRFYEINAGAILVDGVDIHARDTTQPAPEHRHCAAGCVSVCRDSGRQHRLWRSIGQPRSDHGSSQTRPMPMNLSWRCQMAMIRTSRQRGGETFRGTKAAFKHRAGVPQKSADYHLRRSNQFAG